MNINRVLCTNCEFSFVGLNQTMMKTCDHFSRLNVTEIYSIFQLFSIRIDPYDWYDFYKKDYINFTIINGDFHQPLCPLVLSDSHIMVFQLIGLVDSFYKRNVLSFSNHSYPYMVSRIKGLELDKVENINLNKQLLHPNVFYNLESIYIHGSINRIDEDIFEDLYWLKIISFKTNYFRKIMHSNGIKWIRAINSHVNVNVSNDTEILRHDSLVKHINMDCFYYSQEERLSSVFPDEDFCLYVDFPFNQLVLLIQICDDQAYYIITTNYSCTFLWLIQFYTTYYTFYFNKYNIEVLVYEIDFPNRNYMDNLNRILQDWEFHTSMAKCNFTLMKSRCEKSGYPVRNIWGLYDYSILNKKLEIAFRISSYLFSFLGIFTNISVVVILLHKENKDIFKGFKHYDYLCYNSIFSMLILVIQLLSWLTECFYPYEAFCSEIRKLVAIQLFKMIFKECFITAFRFMWNFTYVAFALNRISLIGKDHGKLVKFMAEVGMKTYLAICLLLSCGFSAVKYFKYEINYGQSESSYPISNEHDLSSIHRTHISNDGVIIANSIFDILNYLVFEVIIFIIDIYLLVRLRQTLAEKMKKLETLTGKNDANKLETTKKENEDAINKVIKMVILNTAISLLFRLPIAFIPVVNVFAEFYYKNYLNQFNHPKFGEFYSFLLNSGFYDSIVYCSDLFFNFSLFIQLFIYVYFDKLFKNGFDRILSKNSTQVSNKI